MNTDDKKSQQRDASPSTGAEDGARLTDAQIAAMRKMEPQDIQPTRSFLQLLPSEPK